MKISKCLRHSTQRATPDSSNGWWMDAELKMRVHCAALAHQNDFDVCWARGNVSEVIFAPLVSNQPLHLVLA